MLTIANLVPRALFPGFGVPPPKPGKSALGTRLHFPLPSCNVVYSNTVLQEVTSIKDSYKKKAKMTTEVLNSMENVKCNEVAGAMYAFPRITLPKKAIEAAKVSCPVSGPDF